MKTKNDIIILAKDNYQKIFKEELKNIKNIKENDCIIDKEKLTYYVRNLKEKADKRHACLEVLKENIKIKARESYRKIFMERIKENKIKKLSTYEMYILLQRQKESLLKSTEMMKNNKIKQMTL